MAVQLFETWLLKEQEKIQQNYFTTEGGDKQQKNGIRIRKNRIRYNRIRYNRIKNTEISRARKRIGK